MATTIDKICRASNLNFFLTQIKKLFVSKESGKGLSTNDYSTDEKNKLAGIQTGANNYTLPKASATALGGGVKVGAGLAIATDGTLSASGTDIHLSGMLVEEKGSGTMEPVDIQDVVMSDTQPTQACAVWIEPKE